MGIAIASLSLAAWSSKGSGWRLGLALLVIGFGVGSINPLIEAVVFGVVPLVDLPGLLVGQLGIAIAMSLVAVALSGRWREDDLPAVAPHITIARLVAAAAELRRGGLVLGLIYAVLGGVAPLVADRNPYMPADVRLAHLVEIAASNFIFGVVTGWIFR